MKIKGFLFAATLLASFSCDNMLDTGILSNEGQACDNLSISVLTTPPTKDLITSAYLPSTSKIGVFVTNSTGGDYDGHSYNNIQFTAEGSDANQKWSGASTIELSMNEGNCYAYYPYSSSVSDVTQIPVSTTGQVDYMYATPVTVNAGNKEASLKMKHALSAVRFMIKKGTYAGAGQVTAVSVQSSALGTSGSLNAKTGEVTGVSGKGSTISVSKSLKLTTATQDVDVIVVPTEAAANLTLSVTLDGKTYSTVVSGALVTKANCNKYTLTVNVGELALSGVEIGDWGYNDSGAPTIKAGSYKVTFAGDYSNLLFSNTVSSDGVVTIKTRALADDGIPKAVTTSGTATLSQSISGTVRTITLSGVGSNVTVTFNGFFTWTSLTDGVYAIDSDGGPVDYATASAAASGTYKGVALVMNAKAIEIASSNASESAYWSWTSPMSETEQAYFSDRYNTKATETIQKGYLRMPNGSYHSNSSSSSQIPHDISTWTVGALADVDGKTNTQRILDANVRIASVITNYNDGSHGSNDWYLPAAGQLAYMYMNHDKINNLLAKVGGTVMRTTSSSFWSSSVCATDAAWVVDFYSGHVGFANVKSPTRVRLVRDL